MAEAKKDTNQPSFDIQRLYIKDLSLETPNSPEIFKEEWRPEVNVELATKAVELDATTIEVVLTITVTSKVGEKTAFLIEVQQAGIFGVGGFGQKELEHVKNSFCPNILFPYARETISEAIVKAGFPPLYLAPVNFDALYAQHIKQKSDAQAEASADNTTIQ